MLDDESTPTPEPAPEPEGTSEGKPPIPAQETTHTPAGTQDSTDQPAQKAAKTTAKRTAAKKTTTKKTAAKKSTTKKTAAKRPSKKAAAAAAAEAGHGPEASPAVDADTPTVDQPSVQASSAAEPAPSAEPAPAAETARTDDGPAGGPPPAAALLFQPPDPNKAAPPPERTRKRAEAGDAEASEDAEPDPAQEPADADTGGESGRRRRRRGGRRRRKNGDGEDAAEDTREQPAETGAKEAAAQEDAAEAQEGGSAGTRRRRRRRRRQGEEDTGAPDDPDNTVVRVREPRQGGDDEISGVTGSTRLEAKKQRRREGREAGRRRAPIVSEAEFLARREAVDRVMVVRQRDDVAQIGVLEDDVLVEHYVARESQTSLIGNVYLGRVQNVLPSMEAAFIDIGKGRNAVLYAGEVNWALLGKDGQPRRIETALKSGQTVLVQVTKDPVGHKGARLTSQISLPGRYLVYLPGGQTSGISRKLPDTERNRLKNLLKEILPEEAGVIIRTAAEGASEDELRRDVARLTARWDDIEQKVEKGQAPQLLYGEPDLMIKVVRDLFTEDFKKLVISGDDAWDMIEGYVSHVAPDLMDRVERWTDDTDVFTAYRLDEQIAKALERKVWLPSGGSLIIDRTEAMTVVDVNTGKFTGSGGNLEETVTKNNLEAAEEIVRQLRLRDIGGIIVVDFIDMVLESNRDLVLRRLVECLGRDRTRHQVAEVTSLGLVQMTRKRIGTGLLEAFSEPCESCGGRGLHTRLEPVEPNKAKDSDDSRRGGRRTRRSGEDKSAKQQEGKAPDVKRPEAERDPAAAEGRPDKGRPDKGKQDKGKPDKSKQDKGKQDKGKQDQGKPKEDRRKQPAPAEPAVAESVPVEHQAGTAEEPERAKVQPAEAPAETPVAPAPAQAQPAEVPATAPSADGRSAQQPARGPATAPAAASGSEPASGTGDDSAPRPARRSRRRAASRPAGPPEHSTADVR